MSGATLRLTPLDAAHDSARFNSGSEPLNRYLREQISESYWELCVPLAAGSGHLAQAEAQQELSLMKLCSDANRSSA